MKTQIQIDNDARIIFECGRLTIAAMATHTKYFPFGFFAICWDDEEVIDFAELKAPSFQVDANGWFSFTVGKLYVSANGCHSALFPFGWFCVFWGDEVILDIG